MYNLSLSITDKKISRGFYLHLTDCNRLYRLGYCERIELIKILDLLVDKSSNLKYLQVHLNNNTELISLDLSVIKDLLFVYQDYLKSKLNIKDKLYLNFLIDLKNFIQDIFILRIPKHENDIVSVLRDDKRLS